VNQAHNDYLQLLVETGLAGFSIAVWFLVPVFAKRQASLSPHIPFEVRVSVRMIEPTPVFMRF
jgi:O-antigen ligase